MLNKTLGLAKRGKDPLEYIAVSPSPRSGLFHEF